MLLVGSTVLKAKLAGICKPASPSRRLRRKRRVSSKVRHVCRDDDGDVPEVVLDFTGSCSSDALHTHQVVPNVTTAVVYDGSDDEVERCIEEMYGFEAMTESMFAMLERDEEDFTPFSGRSCGSGTGAEEKDGSRWNFTLCGIPCDARWDSELEMFVPEVPQHARPVNPWAC